MNVNFRETIVKTKFSIVSLIGIVVIGFLIRLYLFPNDVPVNLDAVNYFAYSYSLIYRGEFPSDYLTTNNGWSTFLSIFYYFMGGENFLHYWNLQRYVTIIISLSTSIPIFLLCSRFVEKPYALIGVMLFVLEPRIIQNSLLGISDALFILLITISLWAITGKNFKIGYIAFIFVAFAALVRYEGLLLIAPLSIIFLIKFRSEKKIFFKYLIAIMFAVLILTPMVYIRIETTGQDGLFSHIFGGAEFISRHVLEGQPDFDDPIPGKDYENKIQIFAYTSLTNFIKYLGWILVPLFIIFAPYGIYLILKNRTVNVWALILFSVVLVIPALYAYGRDIMDTRYLHTLYPIICVVSCVSINAIINKSRRKKLYLILIILGIISASLVFIELNKIDYQEQYEKYTISKLIVEEVQGINNYKGSNLIKIVEMEKNFPEPPIALENKRIKRILTILSLEKFDSISEYILDSKDKNLTHILVEEKNNAILLDDVFKNEKDYPYLIKVFDSKEENYKNHMKLFKINYNMFQTLN